MQHFWLENNQGASENIQWDAFKAVMQGSYMKGVKQLKKSQPLQSSHSVTNGL